MSSTTAVHLESAAGLAPLRRAGVDALRGELTRLALDGFPAGFSLAIVDRDEILLEAFGGDACTVGGRTAVSQDTLFDLASLTKVVCTVTLCLIGRQEGALEFEEPVAAFLPEYPEPRTTLLHLLTHTSGLIDHRPFFESYQGREEIEAAVYREAAGSAPDAPVFYSDLNFMLLGWALERRLGAPLDELFAAQVASPLAMGRTMFRPGAAERRHTAATELDGDQRLEPGLIWGDVHDGNAFALGGVSGHAGLFAPLRDVAFFARHLLAPSAHGVLSAASLETLSSRRAGETPDVRGIGWRLEPESWGDWPAPTIWHTGFTGTSILASIPAGLAVVLLTNAVHPVRQLERQSEVRATLHRLIAETFL